MAYSADRQYDVVVLGGGSAGSNAARHLPETGRAISMGARHGLWKLFADRETGNILGSTCLGPRADDLIHQVFLCWRTGVTVDRIAKLFAYAPRPSRSNLSV